MVVKSYHSPLAQVQWSRKAEKQLRAIDRAQVKAILGATRGLSSWPDCRNVKPLSGREGYRLRVGRYRVLFTVGQGQIPVIVQIQEVKKRDERTY